MSAHTKHPWTVVALDIGICEGCEERRGLIIGTKLCPACRSAAKKLRNAVERTRLGRCGEAGDALPLRIRKLCDLAMKPCLCGPSYCCRVLLKADEACRRGSQQCHCSVALARADYGLNSEPRRSATDQAHLRQPDGDARKETR